MRRQGSIMHSQVIIDLKMRGSLRQQLWRSAATGPASLSFLIIWVHLSAVEGGLCSSIRLHQELAARQK